MSAALFADSAPSRMWPRLALLLALQLAALVWMIADRALVLRNGTEILLKVEPVDPRDFFRGDYVTLGYAISSLLVPADAPAAALESGQHVFVRVRPGEDGAAEVLDVAPEKPAGDGLVLRGTVLGRFETRRATDGEDDGCADRCVRLRVRYGIEQYFVPQGEGRAIERITGDGRVGIVAAVAPSGEMAIKRLLVDGDPVYDEPLW